MKAILTFAFLILSISAGIPQIALKDLPGLKEIWVYERTNIERVFVFPIDDPRLSSRVVGALNTTNRDFEGWPGEELYDVYWSDAQGNFAPDGAYISIEAIFRFTAVGGGHNIEEVEFHFGGWRRRDR